MTIENNAFWKWKFQNLTVIKQNYFQSKRKIKKQLGDKVAFTYDKVGFWKLNKIISTRFTRSNNQTFLRWNIFDVKQKCYNKG